MINKSFALRLQTILLLLSILFISCEPVNTDSVNYFIKNETLDSIDVYIYENSGELRNIFSIKPNQEECVIATSPPTLTIDSYIKEIEKIPEDAIFPSFIHFKIFKQDIYLGEEVLKFKNWEMEKVNSYNLNFTLKIR